MNNPDLSQQQSREQLARLLMSARGADLLEVFRAPWLNALLPGIDRLHGCGQGSKGHLEGDVAVHTALVFDNLLAAAERRFGRSADFVERLAVVLHDWKKPDTRMPRADGGVSFRGHEDLAASEVGHVGESLGLTLPEMDKLYFMIYFHGDAHKWPSIGAETRTIIHASPHRESLALLQEADALSCLLPGDTHLPVRWDEINGADPVVVLAREDGLPPRPEQSA